LREERRENAERWDRTQTTAKNAPYSKFEKCTNIDQYVYLSLTIHKNVRPLNGYILFKKG
jgi:hypothetical protein